MLTRNPKFRAVSYLTESLWILRNGGKPSFAKDWAISAKNTLAKEVGAEPVINEIRSGVSDIERVEPGRDISASNHFREAIINLRKIRSLGSPSKGQFSNAAFSKFNLFFSYNFLFTLCLYAIIGFISYGIYLLLPAGYLPALSKNLLFQVTQQSVALLWCRKAIGWPILMFLKFQVSKDFRIAMLRRFNKETSWASRNLIAPAFGAYGELVVLDDPNYENAAEGTPLPRTDITGTIGFSEVFAGGWQVVQCSDGEGWKRFVEDTLQTVDLAVFDLYGGISPYLEWELKEAIRFLPPNRVLLLGADFTVPVPEDSFTKIDWYKLSRVSFHRFMKGLSTT